MKVEREDAGFMPITITLEDQQDLDILVDLVGRIINGGVGRDFTSKLFDELQPHSQFKSGTYFQGQLSTKVW